MSLLSGLLRTALPVGSARRDAVLSVARRAGVLPPPPASSYQRWIESFEADSAVPVPPESTAGFRIVVHPGPDNPAAVTRTLVSLINQTYGTWVAHVPDPASLAPAARRVLNDSMRAEPRLTLRAPTREVAVTTPAGLSANRVFVIEINIGDALAPHALGAAAALAARHPNATMITAEFDMIDPFSGRRSAPAAIGPWEPDLADQFDLGSGCLFRTDTETPNTGASNAGASNAGPNGSVPHIRTIALHRLVGPRSRASSLLKPAPVVGSGAAVSTRRNAGTRLAHPVRPGTTAVLVVRDPLTDADEALAQLTTLLKSAGPAAEIVQTISWNSGTSFPDIAEADAVVIVDGGLTPQETGWIGDLLGALDRPHVFAVAPVVLVPSGVAFDGGVVASDDGLRARSGRTDLAPFELERCRQVTTLSGRVLALRRNDLMPLVANPSFARSGVSAPLADAAQASGRCCLIWAHQRWVLDRGITQRPTDSPMLAWETGRIRNWFDEGVTPHRPEPGRAGEGVW